MPTYEQNKKAIKNYLDKNREKIYEYNRPRSHKYYQENSEILKIKRINKYNFEKECKRLRNILF